MIAPGTVLQDRYVVERPVGEGGMGAVYVATDRRFGSTVALKETFFDDPALRRAFEREARLLNRLRHHALPRVSDHFEEAEGQFLVMEYIPGEDLSQMLKERGAGFPIARVLAWADQLLDALEYLHTQEPAVIHRDIKPQNLKLAGRDQVVLLDFGLAKGTPLQTRVTNTASLFGYSFNYAPIEQMQGSGTDPRSDLYSLGATVYHLLTGSTPPDALTRATAVLDGSPDPLRPADELAAHVPASLADALSRAMSLSAARRFASAEEMRRAFAEAARDVTTAAGSYGSAAAAEVASEQKTRLLDTGGAARTSPPGSTAEATGFAGAEDAATVVNEGEGSQSAGAAATSIQAPSSRATSARGAASSTAAHAAASTQTTAGDAGSASIAEAGGKSVVTRVRAAGEPARVGGVRRTFYALLGVVCVALGALLLFSVFSDDDDAPVEQAAPVPSPQATPPEAPAPSVQQAAEPAPTPQPTPAAAAARARATTATQKKVDEAGSADDDVEPTRPAAPRHPPGPPGLPPEAAEDPALRGRHLGTNPLTEEELRQILRRAASDRRRARLVRERILEEQRRQRIEEQRRRGTAPPAPPPQ